MFPTDRTTAITQVMPKVYAWMFTGLLTTAFSSYALLLNPSLLRTLLSSSFFIYGLLAAQLGLVIYLSAAINKMSYTSAQLYFLLYSALVGISLSPIFIIYTMSSIAMTFLATACMFGGMAIYGYYTEADLSRFGNMLIMALWGLIVASVMNWFFASSQFNFVLTLFGILLFTALTAYDVQKIKQMINAVPYEDMYHTETMHKLAIMGALSLYLDFINLFLRLLELMGKKNDR